MPRQHISSAETRSLATLALVVSAVIAVAVLGTRNLYDDEILSLPIITSTPRAIVHFASNADVHPPGMYLLAHFALRLLPSFRWMNLIPTAVLYTGVSIYVLEFASLFRRPTAMALFLLLATLHPQLLLWDTSYRWYSWWTGIALIALVVALQPQRLNPQLSVKRCLSISLLLAALFYINYITLLFAAALAVSTAARYPALPMRRKLSGALAITAAFAVLAAPQLRTQVENQLARSGSQRSGLISSFAHLAQATLASESYLPWHPLALAATVVLALVLITPFFKPSNPSPTEHNARAALSSLAIFTACFFLLIGLTGLGGRPRNGLLLIPAVAAVLAHISDRLSIPIQQATVVLLALWSAVGISHMLSRSGVTKASMIDRPEQVVSFIQSTQSGCAVVVTYDPLLAFSVSHPRMPGGSVLSPFASPIAESAPLPPTCSQPTLYIVQSYIGGNAPEHAAKINAELENATHSITGPAQTADFSFDPDAARKRSLSRLPILGPELDSAVRLPDYRYRVVAGPIAASSLAQLQSQLPDFCLPEECPNPVWLIGRKP